MQGDNANVDGETRAKFNTLSLLTTIQRLPTPFISAFMLVHLSAPLIASIGGSSASSQVMLLGREYYQGRYTEPLLVFAPLGSKSILANVWKRLKSMRLVTLSAYPALAFFAIHLEIHRLRPSLPVPPISALSPSELDYEFVKYGLHTYPLWAWVTYGGLVFAVLYHASEGAAIVLRAWASKSKTKGESGSVSSWGLSMMRRRRAVAVAGISILTGLLVLWIEPLEAGTRMVTRYYAVYNQ